MSIVELQARARRLGEIRLGDTATKGGKTFPVSLDTFRLTSAAKDLLDRAAELWGGEVRPWQPRGSHTPKWQIVTDATELPVIVPPQDPDGVSWYELWGSGGLQRRCDGEHIVSRDGNLPCECDPDNRECSMVTRLSLMLPDMPDVGIWTLSSTGFYAASEMAMSIQIVMQAASKTGLLPSAVLAIDRREVKRPGQPLKKFVVPILRFADDLSTFLDVGGDVSVLPSRDVPAILPGRDVAVEGEAGSVQHLPSPPPATEDAVEPLFDEVEEMGDELQAGIDEQREQASEVVEAEVVELHPEDPDAETWTTLLNVLAEKPDDGTMGVIQDRTRRLFRFMTGAGLWTEGAKTAALRKSYLVDHLTDLRRAELVEFTVKAFDAAKVAVVEAGDDDG